MKKLPIVLLCLWALCLLLGCSSGEEQRRLLAELEEQNRSNVSLENDSLAETLVAYFDRYGSPNERMRAKYILGRTYYCLGELPRALETYYEAADCADTTDYYLLSRIHAQRADIFHKQVQPRSELKELRLAECFAKKGRDTLTAIECFSLQAEAYKYLHEIDSAILITEKASWMYNSIGRVDKSSQVLASAITPLVEKGELGKAKEFVDRYEIGSGFFAGSLTVPEGREIYYYIKGNYYLACEMLDFAEYLFRRELRDGKDLNNQIAGCKGLQEVFERRKNVDSIAKYANLGYILNDSAYSLAEMQNIQKFQASYNYNHQKFLAEKKALEARIAWLALALGALVVLLTGYFFGRRYRIFKKASQDYRLKNAEITKRLRTLANSNPPEYPDYEDWRKLRTFVEREIPMFAETVNSTSLSEMEYDVCLMVRVYLQPIEIARLKKCTPSYISNIRKNLLLRIFGKEGRSEEFDDEMGKIGN